MKKLLFVAFLLTSTAALAQTAPSAGGPPGAGNSQHQQQHEEKFEERKAKILEHISHRLQEIQQRQSCVQAATTHEALKACMPEHGERGGQGGERGGQGGERGEQGGGRGEGFGGGENH